MLVLVERGVKVRSVVVTEFNDVTRTFAEIMDPNANLMTDEHKKFRKIGGSFASHEAVNHGAKEYVRGNVSSNHRRGVLGVQARQEGDLPALRDSALAPLLG